ncbi:Arm DNA-binding domain-containing protein [Paraburkholderia phenoliruptrix]|uniref:Arm DNA-binding domain-containing protein n=1 Tax=Paraburkholderia phenoliruptrix TaxID=252970 RepID=UPI0035A8B656
MDSFCAPKAREHPYLLADGNGLALRVGPTSTKTWLLRYRRPATGKKASSASACRDPSHQKFLR